MSNGNNQRLEEAVDLLRDGLKADRAAIVFRAERGSLKVAAQRGVGEEQPLSESLLLEVIGTGRTVVLSDAKGDYQARGNVSLRKSGAVSLLCIPFYDDMDRPMGALYADTTRRLGAFHRKELLYARDCASWLECGLAGRDNMPRPELEEEVRVSAVATPDPSEKKPDVITTPIGTSSSLPLSEQMVLFRSLATMTRAGVMIHEALGALARSVSDQRTRSVLEGLSSLVARGNPLSVALEKYPKTFASHACSTVRVGEKTGRLVHVLELLADDMEKNQRLTYRLRSALTYPAILTIACLVMMIFGPPYLLAGQLKVLQESEVPLPALTRGLIALSGLTGQPWFGLLCLIVGAAAARWVMSPGGRRQLWLRARHLPVLGPIVRTSALVAAVRSFSLQLRSGLTALDGLSGARQLCVDPELSQALVQAEAELLDGQSLTESLRASGFFDATFLGFFEAGESSGTLVKLTDWLATFYERELEARLEQFVSLAEPVLMLMMGVVTTLLLVATLKPTIAILQAI